MGTVKRQTLAIWLLKHIRHTDSINAAKYLVIERNRRVSLTLGKHQAPGYHSCLDQDGKLRWVFIPWQLRLHRGGADTQRRNANFRP